MPWWKSACSMTEIKGLIAKEKVNNVCMQIRKARRKHRSAWNSGYLKCVQCIHPSHVIPMTSITELLTILCPLILAADLLLFLGSEIIGDVESLSDLLGGLALDHVGNGLTADIKERLDVKVV
jgi:hypothetical protein